MLPSISRTVAAALVAAGVGQAQWIASEEAKLIASDTMDSDFFGASVASLDGVIVVGSPNDDNNGGANRGAAYVFVQEGASWVEQAKLTASDGTGGDQFGAAVAMEGDVMVVGAPQALFVEGAAYVFVRDGSASTFNLSDAQHIVFAP